jgi:hypothetical protein
MSKGFDSGRGKLGFLLFRGSRPALNLRRGCGIVYIPPPSVEAERREFLPGHDPPICVEQLIVASSIRELTSVQGLALTSLLPLLKSTSHRLPHCAHIHCLVSINAHQASMNVNGCNFFRLEKSNVSHLLCSNFHFRRHLIRLLLCCYLSHGN